MAGVSGLTALFRGGVARSALALGAFGVGALAGAPAQACFFISGGSVQFNSGLTPPCPSGFFDNFGAAQAALDAMNMGGPTTTPSPSATPTVPTTAAPGTATTVTSDNVFQLLGSPLAGQGTLFDDILFGLSARYNDYNSHGSVPGADTYKVGADLGPVRDIRFRGNYQRAVRAPDVQALFEPSRVISGDPLESAPGARPTASFWAGQRFYRRRDVHIQDFFHFDSGLGSRNLQFSTPDAGTGKYARYRLDESAPPVPQDRVFFDHSYFRTPLPTIGTGKSAAAVESFGSDLPIVFRAGGVSDNGLHYSASVEIPVERPAEPSPPPDRQSKLAALSNVQSDLEKVAILLYADEARGEELHRELTAAGNLGALSPEDRAAIRDILNFSHDPASAAEPLDEAIKGLQNPISNSGETPLSGGVVLLGAPPAGLRTSVVTHVYEVSGETRGGVPFDFGIFGVDAGGLSGPPVTAGGRPVVQIFTFGQEGQPQGVRYVADVDGAISAASGACPPSLACQPRKATITLDGTGGSIELVHQITGSASPGAPPGLLVSDFGFAPGGPVQGTTTLFTAPPQPAGLPPILLPVAQGEGDGSNLSDAIRQAVVEAQSLQTPSGFLDVPIGFGFQASPRLIDAGFRSDLQAFGGPDFIGSGPLVASRLAKEELDRTFSGPGRDPGPRVIASPAVIRPNGSAASMLFGESSVGGVGVTSNAVQFAASLQPSDVVVPAQPRGTPALPLTSLRDGRSGDFERDAARFFLDAYIADPTGGRGAANAGAPPPAPEAAPAAQPGHASGQIRLGARDGGVLAPSGPGSLRANMIGRGAVPNGPTYGVRINADPQRQPAQGGGITGALGDAKVTLRDNVVSGAFDVDVRGAERLTERGCQGAGLDCGGSVRNVSFSFNTPDGPPIVDVALGLDPEGRPAPRGAEATGVLLVTLSPNGGAGIATAKVFQNTPGGGGGISLVDLGPAVPIPANGSPEERLSEGIRLSLESVGPQTGRVALNQPGEGGGIFLPPSVIGLSAPTLQ